MFLRDPRAPARIVEIVCHWISIPLGYFTIDQGVSFISLSSLSPNSEIVFSSFHPDHHV